MSTKISLKKEYEEYTTGKGVTLKVHSIPGQLIDNMSTPYDSEKPKRPFVIMKVKGGGEQKRPINQKDEGLWEEYKEELDQWEERCDNFRNAVGYVMAIKKSVEYPAEITASSFEDDEKLLIEQGFLKLPDNEWELKMMWLRSKVMGAHDEIQINWILRRFSGMPEAIIEQQKARFWNLLSGKEPQPMANGNGSSARTEEVHEQDESVLEIQQDSSQEW